MQTSPLASEVLNFPKTFLLICRQARRRKLKDLVVDAWWSRASARNLNSETCTSAAHVNAMKATSANPTSHHPWHRDVWCCPIEVVVRHVVHFALGHFGADTHSSGTSCGCGFMGHTSPTSTHCQLTASHFTTSLSKLLVSGCNSKCYVIPGYSKLLHTSYGNFLVRFHECTLPSFSVLDNTGASARI